MEIGVEAWVAGYAAIVATGALALEIRRWFEAGAKISMRANPNMTLADGKGYKKERILTVNATNRGDAPTTITHLTVEEFPSFWSRLRNRPSQSFVIPDPRIDGAGNGLPYVLQPGQQWTGLAGDPRETIGDIQTGRFWVAVYASHRERPYKVKIKMLTVKKRLEGAKAI
jgi:hypothetical protein